MPTPPRPPSSLPGLAQFSYGLGELGVVAPVAVAIFFLLFFLTTVVGLSPGQAGTILLLGRLWDAINDPLVGWLSDTLEPKSRRLARWGRRYPWILASALPLGITCALQWWIPPLSSQSGLWLYYGLISLLAYTFFTTVQIPFTALAAELTQAYDERTRLMGVKSAFNILGSVVGLGIAQGIFARVGDPAQRYRLLGLILGGMVVIGLAIAVLGTLPHYRRLQAERPPRVAQARLPLRTQLSSLGRNGPFRWLVGLYLCSWMGVQTTAAILPYFVTNWMGLPEAHFIQMALTVQLSSVVALPLWSWVAQTTSKQRTYLLGAPLTLLTLGGVFTLQPGQVVGLYVLGVGIGVGMATFYLVPLAMLPDVIDLDECHTGLRREGLLTSVMVFLQKLALAIALFLTSVCLEWSGWVTPGMGYPQPTQPDSALLMIRWLMGPLPALTILGGLICAWFYPLSREAHGAIANRLRSQGDRSGV